MIVATTRRTGCRWARGWRRYRNYVFIVITMILVAMQVYLYMSTPAEVIDVENRDGFGGPAVPGERSDWRLPKVDNLVDDGYKGEGEKLIKFQVTNNRQHSIPLNNITNTSNLLGQHSTDYSHFCGAVDSFVQSALDRARTKQCKHEIAQVACSYKKSQLYPLQLPRFCPLGGTEYGQHVGCFQNDKTHKIVGDQMTEFRDSNTPMTCVNHCLRSGFEYAGLHVGFECWCGALLSENAVQLSKKHCNVSCPGNKNETCGSNEAVNVYHTGFGVKPSDTASYVDPQDHGLQNTTRVRIVFVMTVNGRAVRQVLRLLKVMYRPQHYYYIHVDARQEYLHRELLTITNPFPNIRVAPSRFASIWGGASLLTMLLQCMLDLLAMDDWHWDYFLNLSESDYPVKTVEDLEAFLTSYPGKNFVKSHGKDTPRFIRKQGLNMLFYECDNHMWRLGSRDMQNGIRIDGGSDWICLNRDFIHYLTYANDELLIGLKAFWKYSLLPGESFFHTVLQNSMFCTTVINNNLHFTNWHRKQGCKCQYKHIVDWCGCSPNDFMSEDLQKIQSLVGKPVYFSRKFEAIINQKIINDIDNLIGNRHPPGMPSLQSFWLNEYHHLDNSPADDVAYSFYLSFARLSMAQLQQENRSCSFVLNRVLESSIYKYNDIIQGMILTFEVMDGQHNMTQKMESFLQTIPRYKSFVSSSPVSRLKSVKIGTNYDPKEEIFRNYGGMFGPQSDLVIEFRWGPGKALVVTAVFIDPSGAVAVSYDVSVTIGGLVHTYQPDMNKPLRPGIWTLKILYAWQSVFDLQFLILPYSHVHTLPVDAETAEVLHSGPGGSYVQQDFQDLQKLLHLENNDNLKLKAMENAKKHGSPLLAWIDELVMKMWHINDICLISADAQKFMSTSCYPYSVCKTKTWSTQFPDPKSDLSTLNIIRTGKLR